MSLIGGQVEGSAGGAAGAAHCLLALTAAQGVLTAQHEAPCEPRHWCAVRSHAQEAAAAWEACLAAAASDGSCGQDAAEGRQTLPWSHTAACVPELADLASLSGLQGEGWQCLVPVLDFSILRLRGFCHVSRTFMDCIGQLLRMTCMSTRNAR